MMKLYHITGRGAVVATCQAELIIEFSCWRQRRG